MQHEVEGKINGVYEQKFKSSCDYKDLMMASNDCLENYLLACNQISTSYDQNFQKYYQKRKHLEKKIKKK